jgi:hypothetical protein
MLELLTPPSCECGARAGLSLRYQSPAGTSDAHCKTCLCTCTGFHINEMVVLALRRVIGRMQDCLDLSDEDKWVPAPERAPTMTIWLCAPAGERH